MRTLSTTISTAIGKAVTQPVFLVEMGFDPTTRAATWSTAITWNAKTWSASGITVENISPTGASLVFPNGSGDPWLALILGDGVRGRVLNIYEHHTDTTVSPTTDAQLVFTGIMDEAQIENERITVSAVEASRYKSFPSTSIDTPTFNYLLKTGDRIAWGDDVLVVG